MFLSRLKAGIVIFNYRDYNNMLRKTEGIIKLFYFLGICIYREGIMRRSLETSTCGIYTWCVKDVSSQRLIR